MDLDTLLDAMITAAQHAKTPEQGRRAILSLGEQARTHKDGAEKQLSTLLTAGWELAATEEEWTHQTGPKGSVNRWQNAHTGAVVYQHERPGHTLKPHPSGANHLAKASEAGAALAKAGYGASAAAIAAATEHVPEQMKAPVANLWHGLHAVLMVVNHTTQAVAREAMHASGMPDDKVDALANTLAAWDLRIQGGTMLGTAIAGLAMQPQLALIGKAASYIPACSMAYVLSHPWASVKASWQLLKDRFPDEIKGAAEFVWNATRHPLTAASHAHEMGTDGGMEAVAHTLAQGMAAASDPDHWLLLFSLAFDETHDVVKAASMATACGQTAEAKPEGAELSTDGEPHKYASTQFDIADGGYLRSQGSPIPVLKALAAAIPDDVLAKDGREDSFHVTIRYGLEVADDSGVQEIVKGFGPVEIEFGPVSLFETAEHDVVKVEVRGTALHKLNEDLAALPHIDTHPTYTPHCTLAYVRSGKGKEYVGKSGLEGMKTSFDALTFSDLDRKKTAVPLGAPADDGGEAIATLYADLYNALQDAGETIPAHELDAADAELAESGWTVDRDEKTGKWTAKHEGHTLGTMHAPRGGINIAGVSFKGGRFIPGKVMAEATPEEKAKVEEGEKDRAEKQGERTDERLAGGSVNHEELRTRLAAHAAAHDSDKTKKQAKASWRMIHRYHGNMAMHRLEELAGMAERALAKVGDDHPNVDGLREQFGQSLAKIHAMMELASAAGVSGEVDAPTRAAAQGRIQARREAREKLAGVGGGGKGGGLPAGERLGAGSGTAPGAAVPGTGEGTGGGSGGVPASADQRGDGSGDASRGPGDAAGTGATTGAGATPADGGGGPGPAGGVGAGGGGSERDGSGGAAFAKSLREEPSPENPTDLTAGNWHYPDKNFIGGGDKAKFQKNLAAVKTLKNIQAEGRTVATPAEQATMAQFCGWGQFSELFNDYGYAGQKWEKERNALKAAFTEEEWKAAKKSITNAHFTDPSVVEAHWKMAQKLGFTGGKYLETSAGIGYYLGLMPPDLAGKTRSSAVELDTVSGGMLKLLYPSARVEVQGFEKFLAPDDFYDLVASNVPFAKEGVSDPRYNQHQAALHDYFFLKSLDLARPGGLVMHVTSTGTLDKGNDKIRAEMMKSADLVAAIRFPSGTHAEGAGTDVMTDMLILRKRGKDEKPVDPALTPAEAMPKSDRCCANARRSFSGVEW